VRITKTVTLGLLVVLALGAGTAFADDIQFSGLTAQWWQVMLSIPTMVNPLLDTTGADCMVGQRGPVWFLPGSFGGTVTRNCSIPEGEWLFFPVINNTQNNSPGICGQVGSLNVAQLRANVAPFIDAATNLSVHVDGRILDHLARVKSVPFATTLPADNIFNAPCVAAGLGPYPAGVYSPSVDDGYYTLLPPLGAGSHILHIHSESAGGFVLDLTYNLTIVPVSLE
jgi:hypothetical protein